MNKYMSFDTPWEEVLCRLQGISPSWRLKSGRELLKAIPRLKEYGLETAGDLMGCLFPEPPHLNNRLNKQRCLSPSYLKRQRLKTGISAGQMMEKRIKQLALAVKMPPSMMVELVKMIKDALPDVYQSKPDIKSKWFLGAIGRSKTLLKSNEKNIALINVSALKGFHKVPPQKKIFILPDLWGKLGDVFDQGRRGTCVAQSFAAMVQYHSGVQVSRQFLYGQYKMIDGSPGEEGTDFYTAIRILSDRGISGNAAWQTVDIGAVRESLWAYNPDYMEHNPSQMPPPSERIPALYNSVRIVNFNARQRTAEVLVFSKAKNKMADELRYIIMRGYPVVVGLPLYESFNNLRSMITGRITLPLPGEELVGYHAMLIVGFDDVNNKFIIRNSWGDAWAAEANVYSDGHLLAGHAIIPYQYFSKKSIDEIWAYSIRQLQQESFSVPEGNRLYKSRIQHATTKRKAAAASRRTPRKGVAVAAVRKRNYSFFDFLRV